MISHQGADFYRYLPLEKAEIANAVAPQNSVVEENSLINPIPQPLPRTRGREVSS
jgi:hypothetical protein